MKNVIKEKARVRDLESLQERYKHITPVNGTVMLVPPIISPVTEAGIIKSRELMEEEAKDTNNNFKIVNASPETFERYGSCVGKNVIIKGREFESNILYKDVDKKTGINMVIVPDYIICAFDERE